MFVWTDVFYGAVCATIAFATAIVLGYYVSGLILPSSENVDILMYEQEIINTPHHRKRR